MYSHLTMRVMSSLVFLVLLSLEKVLISAYPQETCYVCPAMRYNNHHNTGWYMCLATYTEFPNDFNCHRQETRCISYYHRVKEYNGHTWWLVGYGSQSPWWVRAKTARCNCCGHTDHHQLTDAPTTTTSTSTTTATTTSSTTTTTSSLQGLCHQQHDQVECQKYGHYFYTCNKQYEHWVTSNCPHYCGYCDNVQLVLQPAPSNALLALYKGEWGYVCGYHWKAENTLVACRHLGFKSVHSHISWQNVEHDYPFLMTSVVCHGQESKLSECSFSTSHSTACPSGKAVHLNCQPPELHATLETHDHGQSGEGMLLVSMYAGQQYVCASGWHNENANVACRIAGFNTSNAETQVVTILNRNGHGVMYNHYKCEGTEADFSECSVHSTDINGCPRNEYIHLKCGTATTTLKSQTSTQSMTTSTQTMTTSTQAMTTWTHAMTTSTLPITTQTTTLPTTTQFSQTTKTIAQLPIRLVGPRGKPWEGRVEVFYNGQWGTICDDNWDIDDARVVCRALRYNPDDAVHYTKAHFGEGTGYIWMDEVQCSGTETDLSQCIFPGLGVGDCDHTEDAGVSCQREPSTTSSPTTSTTTTPTTSTSPPTKPATLVWLHVVDKTTMLAPAQNQNITWLHVG